MITVQFNPVYQGNGTTPSANSNQRGDMVIYMAARSKAFGSYPAFSSGWQAMGTWRTWPASSIGSKPMPTGLYVTSGNPSSPNQLISARFRKTNDFSFAGRWLLINADLDGNHACYIANPNDTDVYLVADLGPLAGVTGPANLGTGAGFPLQNSQCKINAGSRTASGNDYTLSLSIEFAKGFAGRRLAFSGVVDSSGGNSGWQPLLSLPLKAPQIDLISNTELSPNSNTHGNVWEPSTASGVLNDGTRVWATSWHAFGPDPNPPFNGAYVRVQSADAFGGANWGPSIYELPKVNTWPLSDVFLEFDATNQRFVYVGLSNTGDVYFGRSSLFPFSDWSTAPVKVNGALAGLDYPSLAIRTSGNGQQPTILVGAHLGSVLPDPVIEKFYTARSTDGGLNFGGMTQVATAGGSGARKGPLSRLIWAGNFHVFVPVIDDANRLWAIERWESSNDGISFTYNGQPIVSFPDEKPENHVYRIPPPNEQGYIPGSAAPPIQTPPGVWPIFLAPLIDARGSSNGNWSVVFSRAYANGNSRYNNLNFCTSNRGCAVIDQKQKHQLLGTTSITTDANSGYWYSYLELVDSSAPFPVVEQRIAFFPAGSDGIAGTMASTMPAYWLTRTGRCKNSQNQEVLCFAAGDYARGASNPALWLSGPFVRDANGSNRRNAINQTFVIDPPDDTPVEVFLPNVVPYPLGSVLRAPGSPPPLTRGADLSRRHVDERRSVISQ
ncbi:MAG: hypothetical protein R2762_18095 [Bryobacteraceae bacterium]